MRIFVSEFISSGAMSGTPLPDSLLREGQAMAIAIIGDLLSIPDCDVTTTIDRRLKLPQDSTQSHSPRVEWIDDANAEQAAFHRCVSESDATLIIAPETDGVLSHRVQLVRDIGRRSLNCLPSAIDICADKLLLAEHLSAHGIATIPTRSAPADGRETWDVIEGNCVLKPRDGAGSWLTFGIAHRDTDAWNQAWHAFTSAGAASRAIIQPWIAGHALSVAGIVDAQGQIELFPIARQNIAGSNFQYHGGTIPADIPPETSAAIREIVQAACRTIECLQGYIGIDLLLPHGNPLAPLIVEINPRLTTSYVGYQQLCCDNIAERLLQSAWPERPHSNLRWKQETIRFLPDGRHGTAATDQA